MLASTPIVTVTVTVTRENAPNIRCQPWPRPRGEWIDGLHPCATGNMEEDSEPALLASLTRNRLASSCKSGSNKIRKLWHFMCMRTYRTVQNF